MILGGALPLRPQRRQPRLRQPGPPAPATRQAMTRQQFRDTMAVDKKVQDGKLRLILLKGPLGGCVITGDFSLEALEETLAAFCET